MVDKEYQLKLVDEAWQIAERTMLPGYVLDVLNRHGKGEALSGGDLDLLEYFITLDKQLDEGLT